MSKKLSERKDPSSSRGGNGALSSTMVELVKHHNAILQLCDRLERIADGLPHEVNRQECLALARCICPIIKRAHNFEEENLFPELRRIRTSAAQMEQTLERLKFEHWEDESYAEEISASLIDFVHDSDEFSAKSLSYMFRGFFEGKRRHIAFEVEHLIPMVRIK